MSIFKKNLTQREKLEIATDYFGMSETAAGMVQAWHILMAVEDNDHLETLAAHKKAAEDALVYYDVYEAQLRQKAAMLDQHIKAISQMNQEMRRVHAASVPLAADQAIGTTTDDMARATKPVINTSGTAVRKERMTLADLALTKAVNS